MGFGDRKDGKWCPSCDAMWNEDRDCCSNPHCANGLRLGVEDKREKQTQQVVSKEDRYLELQDKPCILDRVLSILICKECKELWDSEQDHCTNPKCQLRLYVSSNPLPLIKNNNPVSSVASHEPIPIENSNSKDVTPVLMAVLKLAGYDYLPEALRQRAVEGKKKYGTLLKTYNGRNTEMDALQESLDLNQYLFQMVMERDQQIEELLKEKEVVKL